MGTILGKLISYVVISLCVVFSKIYFTITDASLFIMLYCLSEI